MKHGFLLILISGAIGLCAVEILLRTVYPLGGMIFEPDDRAIYRHKPNSGRVFIRYPVNGGDHIRLEINADGFRGEPLKNTGQKVFIYGDSFIFGGFSNLENSLAVQLEGLLRKSWAEDLQVVNAGVDGYGPDQALIRMSMDLEKYQPDLIIFGIFSGNDYGDLVRNRLVVLDEHGNLEERLQIGQKKNSNYQLTGWERLASARLAVKASGALRRRFLQHTLSNEASTDSEPLTMIGDTVVSAGDLNISLLRLREMEFEDYQTGVDGIGDTFGDSFDADIALLPKSKSALFKIKLMRSVLREVIRVAESKGVEVVFVAIPSAFDLVEGYDGFVVDESDWPGYDPRRLTTSICEPVVQLSAKCINLFKAFQANNPESLYFKLGDEHWNDNGQRIAAQVISRHLIDWY